MQSSEHRHDADSAAFGRASMAQPSRKKAPLEARPGAQQ